MFGITEVAAIIIGLILLVWSADKFIDSAAALAKQLGVPPLIIGLVIVGIGTSAPEMIVGSFAALDGNTNLAIGNAIGSNIANIGLVLGFTALVAPLIMQSGLLRRELPILLGTSFIVTIIFIDNSLTRWEGIALLAGMFSFVGWMVWAAVRDRNQDAIIAEFEQEMAEDSPLLPSILWLIAGLTVLLGSAKLIVWGAVAIAHALGVSDLVIGLTIVAIGTSLPELAACIASAKKGEHDIAIGNIIGSNMFNLLGVLGLPAIIHPTIVESEVLWRDYPLMLALTLALFIMGRGRKGNPGRIHRWEGGLLLSVYVTYLGFLFISA